MGDLFLYPNYTEQFEDEAAFMRAVQIKKANWEAFMQSRILAPEVNPIVAQSWVRSKYYNVDPYHLKVNHISSAELEERREKNRVLLNYAKPLLDQLGTVGAGYIKLMSIHDSEGYMLALNDQQPPETSWRDDCFRPGVRWREEDVGTNGIGLVLIEKRPVQIIGQEHYYYGHRNICCCAAPITDSNGSLVGVLNVCSQIENFSPHMMALTALSCYAVFHQLKAYREFEVDTTVLSIINECVLVLDAQLNVIRCSDYAAKFFHTTSDELLGANIQELVHIPKLSILIQEAGEKGEVVCRHCSSYYGGRSLACDVTARPIYKETRNLRVILTIRPSKVLTEDLGLLTAKYTFADIPTAYPPLQAELKEMEARAEESSPVLLLGEQGTCKARCAYAIHTASSCSGPFLEVDCRKDSPQALLLEIFGCEGGGASSPEQPTLGKAELCDGGTLFLDHIDCLPLAVQRPLLQLITTGRMYRWGSETEMSVHVRVIAAADGDLEERVRRNCFLEKLYLSLCFSAYVIEPLRQRPDDIPLVAEDALRQFNDSEGTAKVISPELMSLLCSCAWPNNEQELRQAVSECCCATTDDILLPEHLNRRYCKIGRKASSVSKSVGNEAERQALIEALRVSDNNVERAAAMLRISRATIYRRMKKYGVRSRDQR